MSDRLDHANGPPRVLLVEDNPANRMVAAKMLEKIGCDVTEALDGLEALDAVNRAAFDIILMDLRMPNMDGIAATQHIRAMGSPVADTPIIAITADLIDETIERCMQAGVDECIGKPFTLERLTKTVETWHGADRRNSGNAATIRIEGLSANLTGSLLERFGVDGVRKLLENFVAALDRQQTLLETPSPEAAKIDEATRELIGLATSFGMTALADVARGITIGLRNEKSDVLSASLLDMRQEIGIALEIARRGIADLSSRRDE
ncbi:MAG: response regulator [Rhodospirillaceae bacterium]|nr:response regulator [Rhodospirillaceae bacterium]MBT6139904.1 response regulator [Rhodospirillaceae bacterium]